MLNLFLLPVATLSLFSALPSQRHDPLHIYRGSRHCSTKPLQMLNRIMVWPKELLSDGTIVRLPAGDARFEHACTILRVRNGDTLRVGVLNEGIDDHAQVRWVWPEGYQAGWLDDDTINGPHAKRARPGRVSRKKQVVMPDALELRIRLSPPPYPRPRVDLLLALPRPLQLARILPMLASLGVGTVVLANAAKVEKDYFGSHLIRSEEARLDALVEGLAQSGDVWVPRVIVARRLKPFLEDDAAAVFGPLGGDGGGGSVRLVAHPYHIPSESERLGRVAEREGDAQGEAAVTKTVRKAQRFHDLFLDGHLSVGASGKEKRIVLAVGPEGGWEGSFELPMLAAHGFRPVSIGPRILRSDVAVNALLALAHEQIASWESTETKT